MMWLYHESTSFIYYSLVKNTGKLKAAEWMRDSVCHLYDTSFHNINDVLMVDEQLLTSFVVTAVNKTADQLASNIECPHWMWI